MKKSPYQILIEKTDKRNEDECWPWLGSPDAYGYGRIKYNGKTRKAHREALRFTRPWDYSEDWLVLHSCDNPACVNPSHLRPGTHGENAKDRASRGRGTRGSKVNTAVLTEEQVSEIRERCANGETQKVISHEFGVLQAAISKIIRRVTWKHVK